MLTDRERLIEMIQNAVNGCARHWAEIIADYLLANGVTLSPLPIGSTVFERKERAEENDLNLLSNLTSLQNDLTSLQAENKELKEENKILFREVKMEVDNRAKTKAEAYKECIEKVKEEIKISSDKHFKTKNLYVCDVLELLNCRIDNLIKELEGDVNA